MPRKQAPSGNRKTRWIGSSLILVLFLAGGCIFEPREAAPPGEEKYKWIVPDHPQKVFSNLESGLESLTGVFYARSIGDGFVLVALPGDIDALGSERFEGWNDSVEISVMQELVDRAAEINVEFTKLTQVEGQSDFARWDAVYTLEVTDNTTPPTETTYKGKARCDLRLGSRGWELVRWEDIEAVAGFDTWGYLRGDLRRP